MSVFRTALIPVSVVAVPVLSLVLAGCSSPASGSGGGAAAGTTAGTPAAASNAISAAAPAQGKLNGVPKTCPSADEVMSDLHLSTLDVDGADPSMCLYLYKGPKSAPYVVITFNDAHASINPASFAAQLKKAQSDVKDVPGLADAAATFSGSAGGSGLSFLSEGTICSIFSTVPTTKAGKIALARSILAG